MKIKPLFAWYDLWIGFYWSKESKTLYFLPIPMIGISLCFSKETKIDHIMNKMIGDAYELPPKKLTEMSDYFKALREYKEKCENL